METKKGILVALGGINGSANIIGGVIDYLQDVLPRELVIVHTEDAGRLSAMGAAEVSSFPFGISKELDVGIELVARQINCFKIIKPALERSALVVCKNWSVASRVHYRVNFPECHEQLEIMEAMFRGFATESRIEPDMSIFLDVDPAIAFERIKNHDPQCQLGDLLRMREIYLEELSNLPTDKCRIMQIDDDYDYLIKVRRIFEELL